MSTNHHTEPTVDVKEVTPRKRFRFPELDGVEITAIISAIVMPLLVLWVLDQPWSAELGEFLGAVLVLVMSFLYLFLLLAPLPFFGFIVFTLVRTGRSQEDFDADGSEEDE